MIESEYGTNPLDLLDLKTFQIQSVSRAHANIYKQLGFYLHFKIYVSLMHSLKI